MGEYTHRLFANIDNQEQQTMGKICFVFFYFLVAQSQPLPPSCMYSRRPESLLRFMKVDKMHVRKSQMPYFYHKLFPFLFLIMASLRFRDCFSSYKLRFLHAHDFHANEAHNSGCIFIARNNCHTFVISVVMW